MLDQEGDVPTERDRWSGTGSWFGYSGFKDISETYTPYLKS